MLQDAYYYGCQTQWRLDKTCFFMKYLRGCYAPCLLQLSRYGLVRVRIDQTGKYPGIFYAFAFDAVSMLVS